jgi:coenzyme F420-reducing hydrogenase alpha subunit
LGVPVGAFREQRVHVADLTLVHHYATDERGILTKVNLVVGTTNNYAPIALSVKKAAQALIRKGTVVTVSLPLAEAGQEGR